MGEYVILFCQNVPNAHCVMHDGAWIAFSDVKKVTALNMMGITASASKNKFDELFKKVQKRNVDAILFIAADAVNAIEGPLKKDSPPLDKHH